MRYCSWDEPAAGGVLCVAGVGQPVADTLGRRLRSTTYQLCNYHIRFLLTQDLAQTLACSTILFRIDYCIRHHSEVAVSTKRRGENRKSGTATISCQLAAAGAASAAVGATHHENSGRADLVDMTDVSAGVPEPPLRDTQQHAVTAIEGTPFEFFIKLGRQRGKISVLSVPCLSVKSFEQESSHSAWRLL